MRIKKIHIQNYKSLVDFELDNPPPFCAFVGPNASGKSNIFEALEFTNYTSRFGFETPSFFGGMSHILSYLAINQHNFNNGKEISFSIDFNDNVLLDFYGYFNERIPEMFSIIGDENVKDLTDLSILNIRDLQKRKEFIENWRNEGNNYENDYEIFIDNFSRVFVGASKLIRINQPSSKLLPDASNLSQIIGQIFQDENKKEDFIEWVRILIPEFKNIDVKKSNIDGSYEFFVYEESSNKPFSKHLISDGTYNILALLAAVYQSNEPQFLCIEEPENGLHPEAIELLVDFFRSKCEEEGHHIWLNTHSPTLVRCMKLDEVVVVNKFNGETRAKIETNKNDINIKTDEAWLSNVLSGGVSWSK